MRTFIVTIFILVSPLLAFTQISPEVKQAFQAAKVRILEQRTDTVNFTLPILNVGTTALQETTSLSSHKGKVVILNFWATWCPPCRAEMPSMEALYKRFQNQGLEIIAVDLGEAADTVRQFILKNGYTFPILLDLNNKVGSLYGIQSIPTSYIIDSEGKIIAKIVGSIQWDTPGIIAAFDVLLKSR